MKNNDTQNIRNVVCPFCRQRVKDLKHLTLEEITKAIKPILKEQGLEINKIRKRNENP